MTETTDFQFNPSDPVFLKLLGIWTLDALLRSDVARARERLSDDPTECYRRQYVRAVFAQLEGSTYSIKQLAFPEDTSTISNAEIALLRGEKYGLTEAGEVYVSPIFLTLGSDMRFAFRTYAKFVGLNYELPVNEPGWSALLRAKKVRDRLMHPRVAKDLEITDAELAYTTQAAEWFEKKFQELAELMMDQLARKRGMKEEEVVAWRQERHEIVDREMKKRSV